MSYFRTFKIGRLYFKFIKGTELEAQGWTAEQLADLMAKQGLIRIVFIQGTDEKGRFTKKAKRYVEEAGAQIRKAELIKLAKTHRRAV